MSLTPILRSGRDPLHLRRNVWLDPGMGHRLCPHAINHFCAPCCRLLQLGGLH